MKKTIEIPKEHDDDEEIFVVIDTKMSAEMRSDMRLAKPVLNTLKAMHTSKNPAHGAIVDLLGSKSTKYIIQQGALHFEKRLAEMAELPEAPAADHKISERIEKLNELSVLWAQYNQTDRISKGDGMGCPKCETPGHKQKFTERKNYSTQSYRCVNPLCRHCWTAIVGTGEILNRYYRCDAKYPCPTCKAAGRKKNGFITCRNGHKWYG